MSGAPGPLVPSGCPQAPPPGPPLWRQLGAAAAAHAAAHDAAGVAASAAGHRHRRGGARVSRPETLGKAVPGNLW